MSTLDPSSYSFTSSFDIPTTTGNTEIPQVRKTIINFAKTILLINSAKDNIDFEKFPMDVSSILSKNSVIIAQSIIEEHDPSFLDELNKFKIQVTSIKKGTKEIINEIMSMLN